jgi:hypothetical protein
VALVGDRSVADGDSRSAGAAYPVLQSRLIAPDYGVSADRIAALLIDAATLKIPRRPVGQHCRSDAPRLGTPVQYVQPLCDHAILSSPATFTRSCIPGLIR